MKAGLLVCLLASAWVAQADVYKAPEAFLGEVFGAAVPAPRSLWLTADVRAPLEKLLDGPVAGARLKYWSDAGRSLWILESIGKVKPITVGVSVRDGAIERLEVLVFREERGWEVRYPFFTAQFQGVGVDPEGRLDRAIDGITGATLSVRALKRIARAALYLDQQASAR